MTEHWGGAQWLMAAWIGVRILTPPFLAAAKRGGLKIEVPKETSFASRYTFILVSVGVLTFMLHWGGFW